jgi:hypothetical protein
MTPGSPAQCLGPEALESGRGWGARDGTSFDLERRFLAHFGPICSLILKWLASRSAGWDTSKVQAASLGQYS